MFHGLSAFPLTPLKEGTFNEQSFINLLRPVIDAGVDSLGILGSTGSYAYLTVEERGRIARCAVAHADDIPVIVSIGALRLDDILRLADDAQAAGVSGVAALPNVGSIKLGRVPEDLSQVRARLPDTVTLGIAGDWRAASALHTGFDVWYSVVGGLFPQTALAIARSKEAALSERLEPLWELFRRYGSLRVIAAAAEMMGKVAAPALPFPLQAVQGEPREALAKLFVNLELA